MDRHNDSVLAAQIGRPLRAPSQVVRRCNLGLPVVAEVPPILDNGEPFPTRFWLTCPLAHRRVARIEAAGGVKEFEQRAADEPAFAELLRETHARYAAERDALVPATAVHKPSGGVGGTRQGVKCLHAHLADHWAGSQNPIGEEMARRVEPLDCTMPCVVDSSEGVCRDPNWVEPRGGE